MEVVFTIFPINNHNPKLTLLFYCLPYLSNSVPHKRITIKAVIMVITPKIIKPKNPIASTLKIESCTPAQDRFPIA